MSDTRDAFVKKTKAKLDEWNAEIARLEAKAKQKEADAEMNVEQQIEALKKKRDTAQEDLNQLQQAGENAWEDLKAGVEKAASAFGDAIRDAKARFS